AGVLTAHDSNCSVSSFSMNGWWDIDKLRGVVCEDLVQQIISVPVGFLGSLPDTQVWKGSANGDFSVKSAYSLFFEGCSTPDSCWKSLWSLNVPPKLQYFMWLASQGKICLMISVLEGSWLLTLHVAFVLGLLKLLFISFVI
ncbi:Hypothetical predicted protein, partial [Prunus dulcis]